MGLLVIAGSFLSAGRGQAVVVVAGGPGAGLDGIHDSLGVVTGAQGGQHRAVIAVVKGSNRVFQAVSGCIERPRAVCLVPRPADRGGRIDVERVPSCLIAEPATFCLLPYLNCVDVARCKWNA